MYKEVCDFKSNNDQILNTAIESDKGLEKSRFQESKSAIESYPDINENFTINEPYNLVDYYTRDITNYFIAIARTIICDEDILFLYTFLLNILDSYKFDFKLNFKDIPSVDIPHGAVFNIQKYDKITEIEHYNFINPENILYYEYSNYELSHVFSNRSITRCFNDNYFVNNCHCFCKINFLIHILYKLTFKLDNHYNRITWLFLGKYLSKTKFSSANHVSFYSRPKSCILILVLLFLCGDTGASINPGPLSPTDFHIDMVNDSEGYLDEIDPDIHYFNDTNLSSINFKSYTVDQFKEENLNQPGSLNIMHHNCRSLLSENKLDNYEYFLDMLGDPFDIIGFTETWIDENDIGIDIFNNYKYKHVYQIRKQDIGTECKAKGGGISLFIRDHLIFKRRDDLSILLPHLELLFVELNLNNKIYLIGVAYRPPDTKVKDFNESINGYIEPIKNKHQLILMGDFNICLLQDKTHNNAFRNIMQSNSLFPTILEPTRVAAINKNGQTVVTETLIDNIFIKDNLAYNSGLIYSDISDHYPIFISIPLNVNKGNTDIIEVKYRLMDDFRITKFKLAIQNNLTFLALTSEKVAQVAFTNFFTTFNFLYDKHFLIISKTVKKKSLIKPWVTDSFVEQIKYKNDLARLSNKGRIDAKTYKDYKNRLTKELREAKARYFDSEFYKNNGDIKGTWGIINKYVKSKARSRNVMIKENNVILSQQVVPNKFINYFINIPLKLVSKINPTNINASYFLKGRQPNTFFMGPIIDKDIETAIKNLKNNNNVHTFSTLVLKESMTILSKPLSHIFNLCINQGYFPSELKTGCITPIYKKGDHHSMENYRPVCSLSQFSKIFEKIIYIRMTNYISKNNIICNSQYGFQTNKSTESALLDLVDYVHDGLTDTSNVGAVFMDLSKAFDVMSHTILKMKLEHYGFRGSFLTFLMDFLNNRKYFVCVNGRSSVTQISNIGVPQGSTLGPLLFLIYINDIINCSKFLKFVLFADDTTIMYTHKNIDVLNNILTNEVKNVLNWFAANKLMLNLSKTHSMLFSNKRGNPKLKINIQNINLEEKNVVTFLGVELDNKLLWSSHIKHICSKISKSIGILRLLRHSFPNHILKTIYMSLIYSYINYCNVVWGSAYNNHLNPLVILQKKAVRIVNKSSYDAESAPIFNSLGLLNISNVHKLNCLKFMYSCLREDKFPELRNKILENESSHDYDTRNRGQLNTPIARLEICKRSFLCKGVGLWKELEDDVKFSNFYSFKKTVKCKLIDNTE